MLGRRYCRAGQPAINALPLKQPLEVHAQEWNGACPRKRRRETIYARLYTDNQDLVSINGQQADCLPPGQKRRYIGLTMYPPMHLRARERNQTAAYRWEQKGRRIVSEGTFASLDRLGWVKSRLRGFWRVDCEGYMAALVHNVLKAVRRLGQDTGPPVLLKPRAAADGVPATPNACGEPTHPDGPPGSRSTGFLMMSVAALMNIAAFLWHPAPPSEPTFSTSPLLCRLQLVGARLTGYFRWRSTPGQLIDTRLAKTVISAHHRCREQPPPYVKLLVANHG